MSKFRSVSLASLGVLARTAGALALNKLVATLGPVGGLTALAQFQNLLALFTALPAEGTHVGLLTYLAPLRPGSGRYRAWLAAAVWLNAATLLGGGFLLLGTGRAGLSYPAVAALLLGLALLLAQSLLSTLLLAAGRLPAYVAATAALALLGPLGAGLALLAGQPIPSVGLANLAGQGLSLPPTAWLVWRTRTLAPPARPQGSGGQSWASLRVPASALHGLLGFGLMGASTLLFGRAVDYAVRAHLLATFGPARTDGWQAVARLSDNYAMVFGAVAAAVFYPRLAALAPRPAEARAYVRRTLAHVAPLLAAGLALLYFSRGWLLPLLYSPRLATAAPLLLPQLLGDWARLLSWLLIYQLLARAQTARYVAVQAVSAVIYVGLLALLLPRLGLAGAVWAQALRSGLVLVAMVVYHLSGGWRGGGPCKAAPRA